MLGINCLMSDSPKANGFSNYSVHAGLSLTAYYNLITIGFFVMILSALLSASVTFPPGNPIPASGPNHYGTPKGSGSGTADVFGKGPYDLFVGLETLYPFERFDAHNVPVYGHRITVRSDYNSGYVFQHEKDIYALTSVGNKVVLLKFDKQKVQFQPFAANTLPDWGGKVTGFIGQDKKLHVFYVKGDGVQYYPEPNSHNIDYRPFNGSGFWRGGMPTDYLYYACWTTSEMKELECNIPVEPDGPESGLLFGCGGMAIAKLGPGNLQNRLIAANKLGVFRSYINTSPTGMAFGGVAFAVDDTSAHVILRHPICSPKPVPIQNPISGLSDLIVADTGRMWYYPLKGVFQNDSPIYGERQPLLAAGQDLRLGALPVISPGDIDGDGKIDWVAGNDAGELLFIKNIGTSSTPDFANPVEILAGGEHYRQRPGYGGSIQGPGEANWGYTCPTLFDWNSDGKLDIVMNSISGNIVVMLQEDGKANPPQFGRPLSLYKNSLELHLSWRTQPGVTTWGGTTVPCMIANDEENRLRMYYRIDTQNVKQGPVLKLATGKEIQAHDKRYGGQFGRSKIVPIDWDQDGRIDLLIGTGRAMSIPGPGGIPDNLSGNERQASVLFLRNSGSNKEPKFDYPVRVAYNGSPIKMGTHSCSPAAVNLGGQTDLWVAEEKGTIVYYPRETLSWR